MMKEFDRSNFYNGLIDLSTIIRPSKRKVKVKRRRKGSLEFKYWPSGLPRIPGVFSSHPADFEEMKKLYPRLIERRMRQDDVRRILNGLMGGPVKFMGGREGTLVRISDEFPWVDIKEGNTISTIHWKFLEK